MSTLQELVRYCQEEQHLGAVLLTGEWGCGKTYLIDTNLAEALADTHYIVRVSLLGVASVESLHSAVRNQWLKVCTPFLGKIKEEGDHIRNESYFFNALRDVLKSLCSVRGNIANTVISVDPLEYIPVEPVVEDKHNKGVEKRVVLVFDDLSRTKLDLYTVMGIINDYCENKHFSSIVVAEEEFIKSAIKENLYVYKTIIEKTISRRIRYVPDYPAIIHSIVTMTAWPSEEYAAFLGEHERTLYEAFVCVAPDKQASISKYHNFRGLNCALQEFSRLYELLVKYEVPNIDEYLYSLTTYILLSRNGISRDGQLCFQYEPEEILQLYPKYRSELLPDFIREWINSGLWEEDKICQHFEALGGKAKGKLA